MTTDRIQCPVCQYAHIPPDMETCPQCDADLTCFQLLDRLSDKPPEPPPSAPESAPEDRSAFGDISDDRKTAALKSNDLSGSHPRLVPLAIVVLTLILAFFFIFLTYRLSTVEHLLQRQHVALTNLLSAEVSREKDSQNQNQMLEMIRKQEITLAYSALLKTYMADVKSSVHENGSRLDRIESRLSHLLSQRETDPILDSKKQTQVAMKPILNITEALETDTGSKIIGIDME